MFLNCAVLPDNPSTCSTLRIHFSFILHLQATVEDLQDVRGVHLRKSINKQTKKNPQ